MARLARSGGSLKLAVYGAPGPGFRFDLHLRHRDNVVNLSRLPRDDGRRHWRLATVGQFGWSSTMMGVALRLQEDDRELCSGVLDLLPAFN
jgi:hypothetical protein